MLTLFSSGQIKKRILAGSACALAAGAVIAAGCGGATGGLPSGVSGALNNVKLSTSVVSLTFAGAGSTKIPPGTIAAIGTNYVKVTLKGASYDGSDVGHFFDIRNATSNKASNGFGDKVLLYGQKGVPASLVLPPVYKVALAGGAFKYTETIDFTFKTPAGNVTVKKGDSRKTFDGAGNYTNVEMTVADEDATVTTLQLSSAASQILNRDKFDVTFDFLMPESEAVGEVLQVISDMKADSIDDSLQSQMLPKGGRAFSIYRVVLPVSARLESTADGQVLDLTRNYNVGGLGDPTLNYSAPMILDLTVSKVPKQAKNLNIRVVESSVESGGVDPGAVSGTPRFEQDIPLSVDPASTNLSTLADGTQVIADGAEFLTVKRKVLIVNRLRKVRLEVRAFLAGPHTTEDKTPTVPPNPALDFALDQLAKEASENPGLAQNPVASSIEQTFSTTPVAGQQKLVKAADLTSSIKSVAVKPAEPKTLIYSNPLKAENLRSRAMVDVVARVSDSGIASNGTPTTMQDFDLVLPSRMAPLKKKVGAVFSDLVEVKQPSADPAHVVASLKNEIFQATTDFQPDLVTGEKVVDINAQLSGLGTSNVTSGEFKIKFGVSGTKAFGRATGITNGAGSARLVVEECTQGPGVVGCTATGVRSIADIQAPAGGNANFSTDVQSRGLGFQMRFELWSQADGQGILLAEKVVKAAGGRNFSADTMGTVGSPILAGYVAGDSKITAFELIPAGVSTFRGNDFQVTPRVTLAGGAVVDLPQDFVTYSVSAQVGAPSISILSGSSKGRFRIADDGLGDPYTFTVNGSMLELGASTRSDVTPNITIGPGRSGSTVSLTGFAAFPVGGSAKLTGPVVLSLFEAQDAAGVTNPQTYSAEGQYGFSVNTMAAGIPVTPRTDYFYTGKAKRLASLQQGATVFVLATGDSGAAEQLMAGSSAVARTISGLTTNVDSIRVGVLTSGEVGSAVALANLKETLTATDGQVVTLSPVADLTNPNSLVAIEPDMVRYEITAGEAQFAADGHQISGNKLVISNNARLTQRVYTVRATYFEIGGGSKTADFTLTVPANRRPIEVIIK